MIPKGTWGFHRVDGQCPHCWKAVQAADPAYQPMRHPDRMCVACAKRILDLEVPDSLEPYEPVAQPVLQVTMASEFSRFSRPASAKQVREAIQQQRDVRMLQTGEGRE